MTQSNRLRFWARPGPLDRRLWSLAWPLMLTNMTVPLLGLVDTAVLGHLSKADYLAAVAVGANLFNVLYWAFGFFRMGTTGLVAQAAGRRDEHAVMQVLVQSLILALLLGVGLVILQQPLIDLGLYLMHASPQVSQLAHQYAAIRIFSAPAVLCQYTLIGWMIGVQYPRGTLLVNVLANALNMVLDITLVTGLGLRSNGVAWATLTAEYAATGLGLWLVWQRRPRGIALNRRLLGVWADYLALLQVNRYIMVRTICLLLTFAFFTAQGARLGDQVVAANAVLLTFLMIISDGLDGFANGAEALVGEAVGARSRDSFKAVCLTATRWSFFSALLFCGVFIVGGGLIIDLLTSLAPIRHEARQFLPWIWALPVLAVWSYLLDGIFIGAVQTRLMQNTMLIATLGVFLPAWWLTRAWGNDGLWFSLCLFMLARGVTMGAAFRYLSRPWRWF